MQYFFLSFSSIFSFDKKNVKIKVCNLLYFKIYMDTSNRQETTLTISQLNNISIEDHDTRQIRKKQLAVNIILASIFLERIAYYTLAANIALNLETVGNLHWSRTNGLVASFIFSGKMNFYRKYIDTNFGIGVSYISSIIFAVLSDWKLGRFLTILVGMNQ